MMWRLVDVVSGGLGSQMQWSPHMRRRGSDLSMDKLRACRVSHLAEVEAKRRVGDERESTNVEFGMVPKSQRFCNALIEQCRHNLDGMFSRSVSHHLHNAHACTSEFSPLPCWRPNLYLFSYQCELSLMLLIQRPGISQHRH